MWKFTFDKIECFKKIKACNFVIVCHEKLEFMTLWPRKKKGFLFLNSYDDMALYSTSYELETSYIHVINEKHL
jgi:hypothetical protein